MQGIEVDESIALDILDIIRAHQRKDYSRVLTSFEYFGRGAKLYEQIATSDEFVCFNGETELLKDVVSLLSSRFSGELQIIDLGVGNGLKWKDAFDVLSRMMSVSYAGLDISQDMIDLAKQNFSGAHISYHSENFSIAKRIAAHFSDETDVRIVSMLGNTIGNFTDEMEQLRVLKNAQSASNCPTLVMLGLELFDDNVEDILVEYRNDLSQKIGLIPLELIGVTNLEGVHEIQFNTKMGRVEEWYRITKDAKYGLKENDKILLSVTQKPTESALIELWSQVWPRSQIEIFRKKSNAIVLINP